MSLQSKKVAELRKELEELGLPTEGTKPMLVKRLQEALDKKGSKASDKADKEEEEEPKKEEKRGRGRKRAADKEEEEKPAAKKPKRGEKEDEKEEAKEEKKEAKEEKKEEAKEEKKEDKEEEKEKPAAKGKGKQKSDLEKEIEKEEEDTKEAAKDANAEAGGDGEWKWKGTLMWWETPDVKGRDKLACFDYDGCLANTSLFKKGPTAWSLLFPNIPDKLKELHDKGYKLVIMTNQSDIGKAAKPDTRAKAIAEKVGRLTGFVKTVGLPFQVLVATGKNKVPDDYRKPATGMWDFAVANNGGVAVDKAKSFFVGDAAGRKKDHSDTDKAFAEAAGLRFFTEDVFFKNNAAY